MKRGLHKKRLNPSLFYATIFNNEGTTKEWTIVHGGQE